MRSITLPSSLRRRLPLPDLSQAGPGLAVAALALTAILWSTGGVLIKLVDLPPLAVAGWRSIVCGAFLLLACGNPGRPASRGELYSALSYAATMMLFVSATKLTTAANAILLQFTAPIYVALFSQRLLGEKVRRSDWAATAAVFGGLVLFFMDQLSPTGLFGNVVAMGSGVTFALMTIFMRAQKDARPSAALVQGNVIAAACCLPFLFLKAPGLSDIIGLLLLGVFQLGISYLLFAWAVGRVSAMTAVLLTVLEPLLNPVWVALTVGETPGPFALAGGAMVLVAVTARTLWRLRRPEASAP